MGKSGFKKALASSSKIVSLTGFSGQRIAVEASAIQHWLYHCDDFAHGFQMLAKNNYASAVARFIHFAEQLRHLGIDLVFVFDGELHAGKKATDESRAQEYEAARAELQPFFLAGRGADDDDVRRLIRRCSRRTPEFTFGIISALRKKWVYLRRGPV